jgi:serine phosphatase RsbU (regulator of sigma subunit)
MPFSPQQRCPARPKEPPQAILTPSEIAALVEPPRALSTHTRRNQPWQRSSRAAILLVVFQRSSPTQILVCWQPMASYVTKLILSRRLQPLRDVPWGRLWYFATAVFFLFSVIGFFTDLMRMGTMPYAVAIVIGLMCGLNAALWIVVLARLPLILLAFLVIFQFFLGKTISWVVDSMVAVFAFAPVPSSSGIRFSAVCILVVVIVSYALFVSFIRAEGIEAGRIRSQLELAHGIQKTLVPPVVLRTEGFEIYGISQPSDKVGGDLVDAVVLPQGDIVAYVADIAGHGLPAGILMGMLKTAARTALLDAELGPPVATLPLLLEKLNRVLPGVKEPQMYATLTAFRLNADGAAWYAMAASPPILHWSPHRRGLRTIQEEQFPLGLLPVSGFTGEAIELAAGDLLVVATDGVLEVSDRKEEEFGIVRLEQVIEAHADRPLPDLAEAILSAAHSFGRQADDQTLLTIRRR